MSGPVLRASNALGETVDDPTDEQVRGLLTRLDDENTFVIVERVADPGRFAQALRLADDAWHLEHREGSKQEHYQAEASDLEAAHAVLTGWAAARPGWAETLQWSRWRKRRGGFLG